MILDSLIASTKELLVERKVALPLAELGERIGAQQAPRDFLGALRLPGVSVIAEIKRASPSKGLLRGDLDPAALATQYAEYGAAAISVLTEPTKFLGSLQDLAAARAATTLPVLRKDFVVDPYQVHEARAFGADAFLLIVAALDPGVLVDLMALGRALGMTALVEVHDSEEVEIALAAGAAAIGVNNRNLWDFSVDLGTAPRLRRLVPKEVLVVAESGIRTREDVAALAAAGIDAMLVGEALVTSPDPGTRLGELIGVGIG